MAQWNFNHTGDKPPEVTFRTNDAQDVRLRERIWPVVKGPRYLYYERLIRAVQLLPADARLVCDLVVSEFSQDPRADRELWMEHDELGFRGQLATGRRIRPTFANAAMAWLDKNRGLFPKAIMPPHPVDVAYDFFHLVYRGQSGEPIGNPDRKYSFGARPATAHGNTIGMGAHAPSRR